MSGRKTEDITAGLTRGAADVDAQSQAAVAVVVGGGGCNTHTHRNTHVSGVPSAGISPISNL